MAMRLVAHAQRHLVGYLALLIALGGTSYAAIRLPPNSVTTRQVKDHSLLRRDFKRGQIPRGRPGARGGRGPTGLQGAKGDTGSPAASELTGSVDLHNLLTVPVTVFAPPNGSSVASTSMSETQASQLSPNTTTVGRDLTAKIAGTANSGATATITLRLNGVDTTLSCTAAFVTACNSGGAQVTIPPGSALSLKVTTNDNGAYLLFGWRATT